MLLTPPGFVRHNGWLRLELQRLLDGCDESAPHTVVVFVVEIAAHRCGCARLHHDFLFEDASLRSEWFLNPSALELD